MSERYTSPGLSRRLRNAGLEQMEREGIPRWIQSPVSGEPILDTVSGAGLPFDARALRLDEVLEELHAAGLCVHWASSSEGTFVSAIPSMKFRGRSNMAEHAEAVEAAGLVLLALLEARR